VAYNVTSAGVGAWTRARRLGSEVRRASAANGRAALLEAVEGERLRGRGLCWSARALVRYHVLTHHTAAEALVGGGWRERRQGRVPGLAVRTAALLLSRRAGRNRDLVAARANTGWARELMVARVTADAVHAAEALVDRALQEAEAGEEGQKAVLDRIDRVCAGTPKAGRQADPERPGRRKYREELSVAARVQRTKNRLAGVLRTAGIQAAARRAREEEEEVEERRRRRLPKERRAEERRARRAALAGAAGSRDLLSGMLGVLRHPEGTQAALRGLAGRWYRARLAAGGTWANPVVLFHGLRARRAVSSAMAQGVAGNLADRMVLYWAAARGVSVCGTSEYATSVASVLTGGRQERLRMGLVWREREREGAAKRARGEEEAEEEEEVPPSVAAGMERGRRTAGRVQCRAWRAMVAGGAGTRWAHRDRGSAQQIQLVGVVQAVWGVVYNLHPDAPLVRGGGGGGGAAA
jgi:hypothetical protein